MTDSEQKSLALFLHETGEIIYWPDSVGDRLILDLEWAINGVYAVLDRQGDRYEVLQDKMQLKHGLGLDQLTKTWREYPEEDQKLFLDLMTTYDLGFEYRKDAYYFLITRETHPVSC